MATAIRRTRGRQQPRRERSQELQRLLAEQNRMLQTRKEVLRRGVPAEMLGATDLEEHCVDSEEVEIGVSVLELTSQTVRGIETALQRLEAGEYGLCSDCGSPISSERLRALPFADLCRGCQEKRDNAATVSEPRSASSWGEPARQPLTVWARGRAAADHSRL